MSEHQALPCEAPPIRGSGASPSPSWAGGLGVSPIETGWGGGLGVSPIVTGSARDSAGSPIVTGEPVRPMGEELRPNPRASEGTRPRERALSKRARAALPLEIVSRGMVVRRVSVHPPDVVFVKGLVEASEGLAAVFAERGGDLLLAAPSAREAELHELLADLEADLGARVAEPSSTGLRPATRGAPALTTEAPPTDPPQAQPTLGECGRVQ